MEDIDSTVQTLEGVLTSNIHDIQQLKKTLTGRINDTSKFEHSIVQKLAPPWEEHYSDDYSIPYYFNPETGESSWEFPNLGSYEVKSDEDSSYARFQNPPSPGNGAPKFTSQMPQFRAVLNSSDTRPEDEATKSSPTTRLQKQPTIAERSKIHLQAKKEKEDSFREYLDKKSLDQIHSNPEITNKSKHLQRNVNDMLNWEEVRKSKLAARQQELLEAETAQITARPKVTKAADKLNPAYQQQPVEERLWEYEEKRRLKQQQSIEQQDLEARLAAVPQVAPHTQGMKREGDVADRLYGLAAKQQQERTVAAASHPALSQHDYATGQRFFQPKISKGSEKIASKSRPQVPIEDLLAHRGQQYEQRAKHRELKQEMQAYILREAPKINSTSERIVMEKMLFEGETSEDRLARPIGAVKQRTMEGIDQPTFQPKLSKKSIEIVQTQLAHVYYDSGSSDPSMGGSGGSGDRGSAVEGGAGGGGAPKVFERTQRWAQEREKKLEKERRTKELALQQQCSFRPFIDDGANTVSGLTPSYGVGSQSQAIADRQAVWAQRRDQKLDLERRRKEAAAQEECSFAPNLRNASKGPSSISAAGPPPPPHPPSLILSPSQQGRGRSTAGGSGGGSNNGSCGGLSAVAAGSRGRSQSRDPIGERAQAGPGAFKPTGGRTQLLSPDRGGPRGWPTVSAGGYWGGSGEGAGYGAGDIGGAGGPFEYDFKKVYGDEELYAHPAYSPSGTVGAGATAGVSSSGGSPSIPHIGIRNSSGGSGSSSGDGGNGSSSGARSRPSDFVAGWDDVEDVDEDADIDLDAAEVDLAAYEKFAMGNSSFDPTIGLPDFAVVRGSRTGGTVDQRSVGDGSRGSRGTEDQQRGSGSVSLDPNDWGDCVYRGPTTTKVVTAPQRGGLGASAGVGVGVGRALSQLAESSSRNRGQAGRGNGSSSRTVKNTGDITAVEYQPETMSLKSAKLADLASLAGADLYLPTDEDGQDSIGTSFYHMRSVPLPSVELYSAKEEEDAFEREYTAAHDTAAAASGTAPFSPDALYELMRDTRYVRHESEADYEEGADPRSSYGNGNDYSHGIANFSNSPGAGSRAAPFEVEAGGLSSRRVGASGGPIAMSALGNGLSRSDRTSQVGPIRSSNPGKSTGGPISISGISSSAPTRGPIPVPVPPRRPPPQTPPFLQARGAALEREHGKRVHFPNGDSGHIAPPSGMNFIDDIPPPPPPTDSPPEHCFTGSPADYKQAINLDQKLYGSWSGALEESFMSPPPPPPLETPPSTAGAVTGSSYYEYREYNSELQSYQTEQQQHQEQQQQQQQYSFKTRVQQRNEAQLNNRTLPYGDGW